LQGSSSKPIDLTHENTSDGDPLEALKHVSMKYLHFDSDVRPPYFGTFTRVQSPARLRRFFRNPFRREMPEADYDYDSEAEWEEPGEGEDINSEGEEDADSVEGDEDMEGFLDDDDDGDTAKRKLITTDLEPVSSGLCWEDWYGQCKSAIGLPGVVQWKDFAMGHLLGMVPHGCCRSYLIAMTEGHSGPIDPFSTAYWQSDPTPTASSLPLGDARPSTLNGQMNPPRLPLQARTNIVNGVNILTPRSNKASQAAAPPTHSHKRQVPPEVLAEFKAEVSGSDLTKIALIEHLKKK